MPKLPTRSQKSKPAEARKRRKAIDKLLDGTSVKVDLTEALGTTSAPAQAADAPATGRSATLEAAIDTYISEFRLSPTVGQALRDSLASDAPFVALRESLRRQLTPGDQQAIHPTSLDRLAFSMALSTRLVTAQAVQQAVAGLASAFSERK